MGKKRDMMELRREQRKFNFRYDFRSINEQQVFI